MKNFLKVSSTDLTVDSRSAQKIHNCPHCKCISPHSRPQSPIFIRPASPPVNRTHVYFQRSRAIESSPGSNRSTTPQRNEVARSPRVTIQYMSPPSHSSHTSPILRQASPVLRQASPVFRQASPVFRRS